MKPRYFVAELVVTFMLGLALLGVASVAVIEFLRGVK